MNDRIVVRCFAVAVLAALALVVFVYFVNPLRTASNDPRIRVLGYTFFTMQGRSMEPLIPENARLVVSAWPYRNADPRPGDVIALRDPTDSSVVLAKRVIAGGNSTIEIVDGVTEVAGKPVEEPYLDLRNNQLAYSRQLPPHRVPPGEFFVMGDDRDHSFDSRGFGFVPRNCLIGKVVRIVKGEEVQ